MAKCNFDFAVCVSLFLASILLACISIFSDRNFWYVLIFLIFLSYMFKVQNESPICIVNADMFATPSTTFELLFYVADLTHL